MAWPSFRPTLALREFEPTDADKALKAEQQAKYVKELWIFLASVVALLTLVRAVRCLLSVVFSSRSTLGSGSISEKDDSETVQPGRSGRVSWRRLPTAFSTAFRVVAFRLNIPIGPGSVASVAELLFIFGYITAVFIWLLIDSTYAC